MVVMPSTRKKGMHCYCVQYGANGDSNYRVNSKYKVNMEHFFVQPSTKHIICEDVTIQYEIIVGQRAAL